MDSKQISLDKTQSCRMKSSMVLYTIERALGDFIKKQIDDIAELPRKTLASIREREARTGRAFSGDTVHEVVAATYLDETLAIAQEIVKGQQDVEHFQRLRELVKTLDLFTIRNAVSHPNKDFHPCYWYRVATIASDPLISKLQLKEVTNALIAAEAGKLISPPEDWLTKPIWSLPHNLPDQFDHDITGLIGRKREADELNNFLKNLRFNLIAIVAPGGSGKTALLLDALKELVLSPESKRWVDCVLYFSSKTEVLTSEGIVNQSPVAKDIDSLRKQIAFSLAEQEDLGEISFEEACRKYRSQRVLLCLDNLETILRDQPEAFNRFYGELPREWRVVVTSRIAVNSATVVPLPALSPSGAKHLARVYLSRRGGEKLNENELTSLVDTCSSNPLAIRFAIDGFIIGNKSLNEIKSVAKQKVLEFSYKNLIEAISPVAHEILECLFVISEPISRVDSYSLLERDLDEVAEAFNQLRETSLVTRAADISEERFELSSSVRDLLLFSPINPDIRDSIKETLRRRKQQVSEIAKHRRESQTSPFSKNYVPESAPEQVQVIASEALRVYLRKYNRLQGELFEQLEKVRQAISVYHDQPILYRVLGLLQIKLNDDTRGRDSLRKAFDMSPPDAVAGLSLSYELRMAQHLKQAHEVAKKLVEAGWDNPANSGLSFARQVVQNYWIPLIWMRETEQVIKATEDWRNRRELSGTLGMLRAMAFRQSVEYERNFETTQETLCLAVEVLNEVFDIEGYFGPTVVEGMKLLEQLVYASKGKARLKEKAKLEFVKFVDKHLVSMCREHRGYTLEHPSVREWVNCLSEFKFKQINNPLAADRWSNLFGDKEGSETEGEEDSWIQVCVSHRPRAGKGFRQFLFADSEDRQRYLIHLNTLEVSKSASKSFWNKIKVGDALEVIPDAYVKDTKPITAIRTRFTKLV